MRSTRVIRSRYTSLIVLILSGECIFILPFVITRVFRPSFLKVFNISNFELGTAFSVYGVIAMLSYFFGGPLADRFSPKKLMSSSLLVTGLLGIFMSSIPSIKVLTFFYGLFGMSTILLFWSAFTKATRALGTNLGQGKSFGAVDAGRGLIAALLASISVFLFDLFMPDELEQSGDLLKSALSNIILLFSFITIVCAVLVWLFIPDHDASENPSKSKPIWGALKGINNRSSIWWHSIIVLCSYIGYKCTDDFSLYAVDVFGYGDVEAAQVSTLSFWIRPISAIIAGFLADRFIASKMISIYFSIMLLGSLLLGTNFISSSFGSFFILNIAISSIGIYGLRGLYFTLFQQAKIPFHYTGTAVGLVSIIGFTPDIFMGPLMGYLTDHYPGAEGHQYLFLVLAAFSSLGIVASIKFSMANK